MIRLIRSNLLRAYRNLIVWVSVVLQFCITFFYTLIYKFTNPLYSTADSAFFTGFTLLVFPFTGMIIPLAANIKINYMESKKLSPYFLAVVGLDIAGNIGSECPGYCDSDMPPNHSRYPDNNGYPPEARMFHVSPSIGCDFPVAKWCTLFTEIRADWVPDYSFMVSVGAGVTFMLNNKNK